VAKTIDIPVWLAVLLAALLLWALTDRVILPLLRKFLSRREERFLERIKERFHLLIPAFKIVRRRTVVERLVSDPQVLAAIDRYSRNEGIPAEAALKTVRRYATEIVPEFHAFVYYYLGSVVALLIVRLLYRFRRSYADKAELARIPAGASLVFLMNHRSNMDYILLGYLTRTWAPPSFAAGEWATFWPLRPLIKSMGAFFVRRGYQNALYRSVLAAYIKMAVEGGQVQAVYMEGRLTRDGRLQEPRLGILEYILRGFNAGGDRDVVFIPVGVNYDRVLEDRSLVLDQRAGSNHKNKKKKGLAAAAVALRFIGHNVLLMVRGGWHRFGYAAVRLGRPVSLRETLRSRGIDFRELAPTDRGRWVSELAAELMRRVGRVVPATPVSLVSEVLVQNPGRAFSGAELRTEVRGMISRLQEAGTYVYLPRESADLAVELGLRSLLLRHVVRWENGSYRADPGETILLRYYANSIAHLGAGPGPES
jgi:glycerol-3-phosphate O-acyltransferase